MLSYCIQFFLQTVIRKVPEHIAGLLHYQECIQILLISKCCTLFDKLVVHQDYFYTTNKISYFDSFPFLMLLIFYYFFLAKTSTCQILLTRLVQKELFILYMEKSWLWRGAVTHMNNYIGQSDIWSSAVAAALLLLFLALLLLFMCCLGKFCNATFNQSTNDCLAP